MVGFGSRYDYSRRQVVEAPLIPAFLQPLRRRIGEAFERQPEAFEQVLINEYRPGAGSVGAATSRTSTRSSAFRCWRAAPSACAASPTKAGIAFL